jgi:hypothetical protein
LNDANSQADSAGSIPVTRSSVKAQARTSVRIWALVVSGPLRVAVQLARLLSGVRVAVVFGPLGLDVGVDGTRDPLVRTACSTLVEERRPFAVVAQLRCGPGTISLVERST